MKTKDQFGKPIERNIEKRPSFEDLHRVVKKPTKEVYDVDKNGERPTVKKK